MANIIPLLTQIQIDKIQPQSEKKVYRAIQKQLPKDWLVIHSLEFVVTTSRYNSHGDREADFVVFAPDYGVLVIEVKGGGVEYDNKMGKWYSIDRHRHKHEIKNPLKQAKNAKYEVQKHLKVKMPGKRILLAHGALFPDLSNVNSLSDPAMPIEILGGSKQLDDLEKWIVSIFNYWAGEQPNYDHLENWGVKVANQIYGKEISIQPSLANIITDEIEKQIILTNRQKDILRQLKKRKEAIIEGGAGTGKTILALDHAQTLARQNLKVLFLCYNQRLGDALKKKSQGIETLHTMSFHQFCNWRIMQAKNDSGRDLLEEARCCYPTEDFYDVRMPSSLIDSYEISPIKYNVIVIDEGQDFKEEYWYAIEELRELNEDTSLYIFKDSNQAIYSSIDEFPINNEPLYLFDNCRNTKYIHYLAYQFYQGQEIECPDIEGEQIDFLCATSPEKQVKIIDKKISQLIGTEKIQPKDITIIVLDNYKSAEELLRNTRNSNLWAFKEFCPDSKVLVETARRFKGLEANIIFLWILDTSNMDEKLLYISISRARFRLWIVGDQGIDKIMV